MKQNIIEVDHWGVHLAPNGLWFLEQQNGAQNARKLKVQSPFLVKPLRRGACPHAISLDDRATDVSIYDDEVGRLFLPIPTFAGQTIFVNQSTNVLNKLAELSKLSSPTRGILQPAWMLTDAEIRRQLHLTNIQPLIITNISVRWMSQNAEVVSSLAYLSLRPVILCGDPDVVVPQAIKRYEEKDLPEGAWNAATGSEVLRRYMRDELTTSP